MHYRIRSGSRTNFSVPLRRLRFLIYSNARCSRLLLCVLAVGCANRFCPYQEKETLLFQKGQAQERMKELTAQCERQRLNLTDAGRRSRELERLASEATKETKLAEDQVIVNLYYSNNARLH